MTDLSSGNWDTAIVLPLGVVAGQLGRIETQLRSLNMTALRLVVAAEGRQQAAAAELHLDPILERLDSIRELVTDIQRDLRPIAPTPETPGKAASAQSPEVVGADVGGGLYADAQQVRRRKYDAQRDRDD